MWSPCSLCARRGARQSINQSITCRIFALCYLSLHFASSSPHSRSCIFIFVHGKSSLLFWCSIRSLTSATDCLLWTSLAQFVLYLALIFPAELYRKGRETILKVGCCGTDFPPYRTINFEVPKSQTLQKKVGLSKVTPPISHIFCCDSKQEQSLRQSRKGAIRCAKSRLC